MRTMANWPGTRARAALRKDRLEFALMSETTPDLEAYAARLGLAKLAPGGATLANLGRLQEAHLAANPFENLEPRLGRPVPLGLAELEAKLVRRRRGGYCFEQNSLFAAVLRVLGFTVELHEARVHPSGGEAVLPRTHMALAVTVAGDRLLVDVGFGGSGPLVPIPFAGNEVEEPGGRYRLRPDEAGLTTALQRAEAGGWADLYRIEPRPVLPIDLEVANHYTATHPTSIFVRNLTLQRSTREARHVLRGRTYTRQSAASFVREGLGDDEVADLAATVLGLEVSRDEIARALAGNA